VASGALTRSELLDHLTRAFADLPEGRPVKLPDLALPAEGDEPTRRRIERDLSQSILLRAWRIPQGPNEDRAALALLQKLLNGQSGRLFESLRNRRSLCYATGVQVVRGFGPGLVVGYVLTSPETETEAGAALAEELEKVAASPAGAEEFDRARRQLVGNLLISQQSNSSRVSRCATDVLYGRAPNNLAYYLDEIESLDPERVRATAETYLGGGNRYEVTVGPAAN